MRPIHTAQLDKRRPVLVLTREIARQVLTNVTVAPITSQIRGLAVEVPIGPRNGLDEDGCDETTVRPHDSHGGKHSLTQKPSRARVHQWYDRWYAAICRKQKSPFRSTQEHSPKHKR